jgi:phage gp36-like protein
VARAAEALAAAEAEIDSRLVVRYAVPVNVATEPEAAALLKSLALDLAEHRLHARRPPVPQDVRDKAAFAREWLHNVLVGSAHLPLLQSAAQTTSNGVVSETSGPLRVFRRDEDSAETPA